jgi:hypothetical protein
MRSVSPCYANANLRRFTARGYPADRGGDGETPTHGPFGVGLTCLRPAEIDQHAVTDIARDKAVNWRMVAATHAW